MKQTQMIPVFGFNSLKIRLFLRTFIMFYAFCMCVFFTLKMHPIHILPTLDQFNFPRSFFLFHSSHFIPELFIKCKRIASEQKREF